MAKTITLIKGDGTGPELANHVKRVIKETVPAVEFEEMEAGVDAFEKFNDPIPEETLGSIERTKVVLKAPITTPVGSGYRSINVQLRKMFNLYANLRPAKYIDGVPTPITGVDIVIVRENTEDLYIGREEYKSDDEAVSYKIITRKATELIADFAFNYAKLNGRKRVTIVHKANILKYSDGLFLKVSQEVSKKHPEVECDDRIVDNMCMQLIQKPKEYDMLLCPNLYGDIISDLCAGLVGGLGVAPSGNFGKDCAMFEAVHGSAPKYKGQDKVNPTALLLSACLMLRYIGETSAAEKIENAVRKVISEGKVLTYDLARDRCEPSKATDMISEIINKVQND